MMHKHAKSNTFSGNYDVTQKQRQRETLLLCAHETENTEDEVDFGFFLSLWQVGCRLGSETHTLDLYQ